MQQTVTTESGDQVATVVGSDAESDTVVVHVQLRPRRGSTRRCLAALAELAGAHPAVSFTLTGLSKDDRVVRVTVGVELGPRAAVARFSPQAQAAYAFVSSLFTTLYDHMPVYTVEPGEAERAAAADLMAHLEAGPATEVVPAPRRPAVVEHEEDAVLLTPRKLATSL
ncbi:hypothetical protein [Geodermatophilus obscurus]|uniref:Uncharacterized protein n=1 Tax=Geodermatophilus obscurus (strain ATCC 25078 / DSM 43160 / JCM 3152 / CCUG 61914 / KCC A-0152 / KCTC 9177 / NBRC 13315 / NRRL B-3577 / G-20) TaxID=526225 RepID=D2S9P1_GEOOG|nr:hypothetical protein [Geodermatophilus obscurus]ADB73754.1 hypothetical protein Gobs_0993 [Geodermatophilus obscurus DSM 43160]